MEYDREVARDEELAAREAAKKKRFTLFKNKQTSDLQSTPHSATPASTKSSPPSQIPADNEDDLPARTERPSSTSTKPNPTTPPTEDESVSHIPVKAGFDFKAIAKVIGKEDLDSSALPMVPVESIPRKHPPSEHVALERTGSAPLPQRVSPSPEDSDMPTPKTTILSLSDQPSSRDEDHSLPAVFQRSLSMSDASALREDWDSRPDVVSPAEGPYGSLASSKRPQPPSWPPPNALLSDASSEGPVWASSPANDYSTTAPSLSISNSGPLRRQAPPSISFGTVNGVLPASTASGSSTPEISFGSADGNIMRIDGRTRDPWAPKPIGLDAAIARKTNYTLNPWET
jgi:hypothetical protein